MAASKPTAPDDLAGLSDERLQALHERFGEHREALRLEHRRVVDEVHARQAAGAEQADEPTGGTVGTTAPQEA